MKRDHGSIIFFSKLLHTFFDHVHGRWGVVQRECSTFDTSASLPHWRSERARNKISHGKLTPPFLLLFNQVTTTFRFDLPRTNQNPTDRHLLAQNFFFSCKQNFYLLIWLIDWVCTFFGYFSPALYLTQVRRNTERQVAAFLVARRTQNEITTKQRNNMLNDQLLIYAAASGSSCKTRTMGRWEPVV